MKITIVAMVKLRHDCALPMLCKSFVDFYAAQNLAKADLNSFREASCSDCSGSALALP